MCIKIHIGVAALALSVSAVFARTPRLLTSWDDLDAAVSETYDGLTNGACIYLPGPWSFGLAAGYRTFPPGSEISDATNLFTFSPRMGIPVWTVRAFETQAEARVWLYRGTDGSAFRTNPVPAAFDPRAWVRDAYGDPPAWLSPSGLDGWYADRDRSRMWLELTLIASNDWPLLQEARENAATNTPMPENPPPTLPTDTNRLAFAGIENTSGNSMRLWMYTPVNPVPVDIFTCAALTGGPWALAGSVEAGSAFEAWETPPKDGTAFFHAARGDTDSDGDGIADGRERLVFGTDPLACDSDGEGLSDREELYRYGTNPNAADSDGDGVPDNEDFVPCAAGPAITISAPQDGTVLAGSSVSVSGSVVSSNGLDSVWVQGTRVAAFELGDNAYGFTNTFRASNGALTVLVTANSTNAPALESRRTVSVTVDDPQPPGVTILSPSDAAEVTGACVRVEALTDSTDNAVTVNGQATAKDGCLRYAWVTLGGLGANALVAVAADAQGRTGTNSVSVFCSDLTYADPEDDDCDGVPDADDPAPSDPTVRSTVVITYPPNGEPGKLGGSASSPFDASRVQTVRGNALDGETSVDLEVRASSLPPAAKRVYTVPVQGGAFSQDVKLFPGQNLITAKTATGAAVTVAPRTVPGPTLTVELNVAPPYSGEDFYMLFVNDNWLGTSPWNGESYGRFGDDGTPQSVVIRNAEAGLYRVYVQHAWTLGTAPRATTVRVRLDNRLIYQASNADGIGQWSVGTFVIHSGDATGGFAADGEGRTDLPTQGARMGAGYVPDTLGPIDFVIEQLSGPNGAGAVCLEVGCAAQFTARGTCRDVLGTTRADGIIDCFGSSDESVGVVDELGFFLAMSPGHTRVSCIAADWWYYYNGWYAGDRDCSYRVDCDPVDVYVVKVGVTVDTDLDGDIDDADTTLMASRASPYRWNMPVATNVFRPVRLDTGADAPGALGLSLAGGAAFRVWATAAPGPDDRPLIDVSGGSAGGDALGVSIPYMGETPLYVEAVSNGTATLTYAFAGSGSVAGSAFSNSVELVARGVSIAPRGQVTFANSAANVAFHLSPGCWTNCVWTLSSGTARFADGPTSEGLSQTWYGTSVWVNPGSLATNYTVTCQAIETPEYRDVAGLVVSREIAWTPAGDKIYVWSPIAEDAFGNGFYNALTAPDKYQGWSCSVINPVTKFFDPDPTDDDFGTCTLANLKAMANGGILFVQTHGQVGVLEIARCATETAANAWKGSEPNMDVMPGPIPETNYWSVLVYPKWFSNNWKPSLDQRKAIIFLEACYSADGYPSIASGVGGKTALATHDEQYGPVVDEVFRGILGYMTGTSTSAENEKRVAKNAYASLSSASKTMVKLADNGDGLSTLCPTPQSVFPTTTEESKAKWGCILFDSYMDNSVSAVTAVVPITGTIGTRSWKENGTGSFFIDFLHSGSGVSVEAIGNKCRSAGGGAGVPMDGNAVAPMPTDGESKVWSW